MNPYDNNGGSSRSARETSVNPGRTGSWRTPWTGIVSQGSNMRPTRGSDGDAGAALDNVQDRFELFLLQDGEKKVTEEADTRIPSASKFFFKREDHTLGNLLSSRLLQSPNVTFSGYKIPHPLEASFELRIQTDGTITPRQALMQACKDLVNDLGILGREFTKEWELRKIAGDGGKTGDQMNGR